jgi:hypothetical protein
MEQSVPKRRHVKFRRQGITQKKAFNVQIHFRNVLFEATEDIAPG